MGEKYNKALIPRARELRRNMTKEERHLWYDFLRNYPVKFVRQKVIGRYIVDFYCASVRLAVEVDGTQHYGTEGMAYDRERTDYLRSLGVRTVRVPNNEVNGNFPGVCACIDMNVKELRRTDV